MLNESQSKQLEQTAAGLAGIFKKEVERLIASGGVSPDPFGDYPLCTIMYTALENLAGTEGSNER
jgi:hypothetical protein